MPSAYEVAAIYKDALEDEVQAVCPYGACYMRGVVIIGIEISEDRKSAFITPGLDCPEASCPIAANLDLYRAANAAAGERLVEMLGDDDIKADFIPTDDTHPS